MRGVARGDRQPTSRRAAPARTPPAQGPRRQGRRIRSRHSPRTAPASRPGVRDIVRVVGDLAVRDVEDVGAQPRLEVRDRRLVEVARHRVVDRVVRGWRSDLPAVGVEQPLTGRVPVDLERKTDAAHQPRDRGGLRFRGRPGTAVGVARRDVGRALVVVAPVVGEVPVRVDAVADLRQPSPLLSRRFLRQSRSASNVYW